MLGYLALFQLLQSTGKKHCNSTVIKGGIGMKWVTASTLMFALSLNELPPCKTILPLTLNVFGNSSNRLPNLCFQKHSK